MEQKRRPPTLFSPYLEVWSVGADWSRQVTWLTCMTSPSASARIQCPAERRLHESLCAEALTCLPTCTDEETPAVPFTKPNEPYISTRHGVLPYT